MVHCTASCLCYKVAGCAVTPLGCRLYLGYVSHSACLRHGEKVQNLLAAHTDWSSPKRSMRYFWR